MVCSKKNLSSQFSLLENNNNNKMVASTLGSMPNKYFELKHGCEQQI
jgi:hypothetical protein